MKKLIILLLTFTLSKSIFGQTSSRIEDSSIVFCQTDGATIANLRPAGVPQASFPSSLIVNCAGGTFRVYYEDLFLGLGEGFNDPIQGANRRNTFCAVLSYIKSIYNLNGQTLDIYMQRSYDATNPAPANTNFFAQGGPYNIGFGASPGFFGGNFFDHVFNSSDPDPTNYDGTILTNFQQVTPIPFGPVYPINYWNDYLNTSTNCNYDLYSILLHEMMHVMGWYSGVGENTSASNTLMIKSNSSGIPSFTRFDLLFLYAGDVRNPSTFTGKKLVLSSPSPALNPALVGIPNVLRNNSIWMNNNGAPMNHKVYDGFYTAPYTGQVLPPVNSSALLGHMDHDTWSFYRGSQWSPGYQPIYVVSPSININQKRRTFSLPELRYLNQLGYSFDPTFGSSSSLSGGVTTNLNLLNINQPPYRNNIATTNIVYFPSYNATNDKAADIYSETKPADFTITNNNSPSGPILTTFPININTLPGIADNNLQTIGIYPNSLYGIRGVTSGGNNHNAISITSSNTIIYTPPAGFIGRAEFAFNLWDGLEIGAKKVITIDVQAPAGGFGTPVGNNLVINGTFEDLTERTTFSNLIPNSTIDYYGSILEVNYARSLAGAHPYSHAINKFTYGGGMPRKESYANCTFATSTPSNNTYGDYVSTFGSYVTSLPIAYLQTQPTSFPNIPSNECYQKGGTELNAFNFTLMDPLVTCKNYRLEFDVTWDPIVNNTVQTLKLQAINNILPDFAASNNYTTFNLLQTIQVPIYVTGVTTSVANTNWQHVTFDFFYCGSSTRYLNFESLFAIKGLDNLSLKQLTTSPPPLLVSAVNSSTIFCAGNTTTLTGLALNTTCSLTYTWLPMNINTSSVVVTPTSVTQSYTLIANDGCRTGSAVINPVPSPAGSFTAPPACIGTFGSNGNLLSYLTPTIPVGGLISGTGVQMQSCGPSNCFYLNLIPASSFTPGIYTYTYTYVNTSNCTTTYTFNVLLTPSANASISINPICVNSGQNLTLTAIPSSTFSALNYTWQPSGQNTNSIIVTPTNTTTYTLLTSNSACSSATTTTVYINPTISFTNVPLTWCTYQSIFYLEQYLSSSTPTGGVWSGDPNIGTIYTASLGLTALNINPVLTTIGTHTITYCYTSPSNTLCTSCNQFTINVQPGFALNASTNGVSCTNIGLGATISATASPSTGVTYTWSPGSLTGASQTVNPSSNTTYTVFASNSFGCIFSNVASVIVSNACCTATNYITNNIVGTPTTTTSLFGYYAINQNLTIQGLVYLGGVYAVAPNIKITVAPNATLVSTGFSDGLGLHMYSCGNMWDGIEVQNGGKLNFSTNNDLIEDALTAVRSDGATNTSTTNIDITIEGVVFNRNYTALSIKNYTQTVTNAPFSVIKSVFCSRDFSLTPFTNVWPHAGSVISTDLRYASPSTPTTGLVPPYPLTGANISTLKVPYSSFYSYYGIYLENVGLTSGSNFYQMKVGSDVIDSYFNLFDSHAYGIYALNSNLQSFNNVFQNTQRNLICNPKCKYDGGAAIKQEVNTTMNAKLDLVATSSFSTSNSVANRFWNCYSGIEAYNVYRINVERAVFRSTQTTAGGTSILPGNIGFYANTNRFQYNLRFNEFSNINTAVNIPLGTGAYDVGGGVQNGIYAAQMVVAYNNFGPQTATSTAQGTNYLNNAIFVSSPLSGVTWQLAANTGLFIQNNTIDRAYRGISVNGMNSYSTVINNNNVKIVDDNMLLQTQKGIEVVNTLNKVTVTTNTLSATNITNTLIALAYFGNNVGTTSPSVTCNKLSNSFKGFEFNNANNGTFWRGNTMQTHARGLTLANNATISVQGSSGSPQDNLWNGTWTAGTNFGTYMDNSDATKSGLWYKSGSAPPTPTGNVTPSQFYGAPLTLTMTTGVFSCGGGGNGNSPAMLIAAPSSTTGTGGAMTSAMAAGSNSPSAQDLYVGETTLYRYFNAYPSVKNTSTIYVNFYNSKQNTSTDKFTQIEGNLYNGQTSLAQSNNNAVTATNAVEANYKNFYGLYVTYKNGTFNSTDSTALVGICDLCAGLNGAVVYQARALYSNIYKSIKLYKENCASTTASNIRLQNLGGNETVTENTLANTWSVDLFPNPNKGSFSIVSKNNSEDLFVTIVDVTGKVILSKTFTTSNFIANLELNTKAGIYLITIKNNAKESITKKLVITD